MFERIFGRKEKKSFVTNLDLLGEIIKEAVSDESLHSMLDYWAGASAESFSTRRRASDIEIVEGNDPENQKIALRIGIGETSLVFDNRSAIPNSMVYKAKPYTEIKSTEDLKETVYEFIGEKPTPEQIIDLERKSVMQRMYAKSQGQEVNPIAVEHLRRRPKPESKEE